MKKCSKCEQWKDLEAFAKNNTRRDGLQSWCRECQQCYNGRYMESEKGKAMHCRNTRGYNVRNPVKIVCQRRFGNAIKAGKISRPEICSACEQANGVIHGHHADYSKPLDVMWLCADCHRYKHQEEINVKAE